VKEGLFWLRGHTVYDGMESAKPQFLLTLKTLLNEGTNKMKRKGNISA
jgi:hypothetical protein